jgi:hypothetical protein
MNFYLSACPGSSVSTSCNMQLGEGGFSVDWGWELLPEREIFQIFSKSNISSGNQQVSSIFKSDKFF